MQNPGGGGVLAGYSLVRAAQLQCTWILQDLCVGGPGRSMVLDLVARCTTMNLMD